MQVKRYASVTAAEAAFTPTANDKIIVRNMLRPYREASDFDFTGRSDCNRKLCLPYDAWDAECLISYLGGIDEGAAPHSASYWNWTAILNGTGTITENAGNEETTFYDPDASSQAYIEKMLTFTGDIYVFVEVKCTAVGGSYDCVLTISDNDVLNVVATVDFGDAGIAGDLQWYNETSQSYSLGTTTWRKLVVVLNSVYCAVYDYDTGALLSHVLTANLPAATTSYVRFGSTSLAGSGTIMLKGKPGLTVLQSRMS